jgi:hypothetical protein
MAHLPAGDLDPGHGRGAARGQFHHVEGEAAIGAGRTKGT